MADSLNTPTLPKLHPALSRRSLMREMAAASVLAATAVPVAAAAKSEITEAQIAESVVKPLAMLGRAMVDGRIDVNYAKSNSEFSVFTIRLERRGYRLRRRYVGGNCFRRPLHGRRYCRPPGEKTMMALDIERIRPILESEIERLIAALNLLDNDPDFEDGGDLEEVCEDEGAQCDDEGVIDGDQESVGCW